MLKQVFKRIEEEYSVNGRGPREAGRAGSGVTVVAEHWGSGWSKSPTNTHGTKQCDLALSIIPTSWPQREFWGAVQAGCTLSSQWIAVLVPHMVEKHHGKVGCWHVWEAAVQAHAREYQWDQMSPLYKNCPLPSYTECSRIVQIRTVSLEMQEDLLAQQTEHQ